MLLPPFPLSRSSRPSLPPPDILPTLCLPPQILHHHPAAQQAYTAGASQAHHAAHLLPISTFESEMKCAFLQAVELAGVRPCKLEAASGSVSGSQQSETVCVPTAIVAEPTTARSSDVQQAQAAIIQQQQPVTMDAPSSQEMVAQYMQQHQMIQQQLYLNAQLWHQHYQQQQQLLEQQGATMPFLPYNPMGFPWLSYQQQVAAAAAALVPAWCTELDAQQHSALTAPVAMCGCA